MSTFQQFSEFINDEQLKCVVAEKALKSFILDLKANKIKFSGLGNTIEVENTFKARMAIRMVKERFGMQSIIIKK